MTLVQAQKLINQLAKKFNVSQPKILVKYNSKIGTRSQYYFNNQTIKLASWDIKVDTLLHEFAHHLCKISGRNAHKEEFYLTLTQVVYTYYKGDYKKYLWSGEYYFGRKFYQCLTLLTKEEIKAIFSRRRKKMDFESNISKPVRSNSTFLFKDIPVGGGIRVSISEGEELEKVAIKVRNAVASFKKANKDFHLSTSILENEKQVIVYRDAIEDVTEQEGEV